MTERRQQEGELTFLAVASPAPQPSSVVEPKTCPCGTTFYRTARPADGSEPQKWCKACLARQTLREQAKRSCPQLPVYRQAGSKSVAEQVREQFGPKGESSLRRAVIDKLRRAAS